MKSAMGTTPSPSACEIVCVLDRSGSMSMTRYPTQQGFNTFMQSQREVPGHCFVSLYQFDHEYTTVYEGRPVADVPPLIISPRGSTALYDAIGRTLTTAFARITGKDRKVIIVVATDGGENASREYNKESVAKMLAEARARGWECVFIGANEDAVMSAQQAGYSSANVLASANNAMGTMSAYRSISKNAADFRTGFKEDMSWTAEDRGAQEAAKKTAPV